MNQRFGLKQFVFIALLLSLSCGPLQAAINWLPFGPDGGDARSFAADPHDSSHIYLGTANGWLYESRNGGADWARLARVGKRDDLVLDDIVVDPTNVKHLVIGAWVVGRSDGGVYVSHDAGATWTSNPVMKGQKVLALAASASDPKTMVAGTLTGIYRSVDGGNEWSLISPADSKEIHEVESIAIDPADPKIIYAGTWHLPWKTEDGGEHWHNIKEGIIEDSDVFSIILDPKDTKTVFASACSGIYKSENAGDKFSKVQGIPSTARRTRVLMQDPEHLETVFAGTTEGLYRSDDSGKTWVLTTGPELIINDVFVDPKDHTHVLLATDRGGVMVSHDRGTSFTPSNAGFSARQITSWVAETRRPAVIYAGVVNDKEWGGVFMSQNGGLSWVQASTGLGGRDVFSLVQASDGTIIAGTAHGLFRLDKGVWGPVTKVELAETGERHTAAATRRAKPLTKVTRVAPKAVEAKADERSDKLVAAFDVSVYGMVRNSDELFAVTSAGLLKSGTAGESWQLVAGTERQQWTTIAVSRTAILVAGLKTAAVSQDSGKTWLPVTLPEQLTQVSASSVDDTGAVWVGGREGAYITHDKGATWETLKDLYLRDVNSIYFDEATQRMLLTANNGSTMVLAVHLPDRAVKVSEVGWNLRFVRPVGDHLVGATLFDGVVVQPQMVDSSQLTKQIAQQ